MSACRVTQDETGAEPVGIEDSGGMAAKQRDHIRKLSLLIERNDGEGAAAAGLPIDREVLGVCLISSASSQPLQQSRASGP